MPTYNPDFHCRGRIRLDFWEVECRPFVPELFRLLKFTPVRAEAMLEYKAVEYSGYSPYFDEIGYGERIPVYEIEEIITGKNEVGGVGIWRTDQQR